jgi:hypothetical protein
MSSSPDEPPIISDPVDERVWLSRVCRAYLDSDIRDPLLIAKVQDVAAAADELLAAMRDDDA